MSLKQKLIDWGFLEKEHILQNAAKGVADNFIENAMKHYCNPCERWFSDTRGLLMHNRHKHK